MQRIANQLQLCIESVADGFSRIDNRPGYWFRRQRSPLFSFIVVQHSAKFHCFEVDVASTVFEMWDRQYGTHQLRRATGLPFLRQASGTLLMEDVPYTYVADPREALVSIAQDLQAYALPWYESHEREINEDKLVQHGSALMLEAERGGLSLDDLKTSLRKEADKVSASKWQRKETAILAIDLLRWSDERRLTLRST